MQCQYRYSSPAYKLYKGYMCPTFTYASPDPGKHGMFEGGIVERNAIQWLSVMVTKEQIQERKELIQNIMYSKLY